MRARIQSDDETRAIRDALKRADRLVTEIAHNPEVREALKQTSDFVYWGFVEALESIEKVDNLHPRWRDRD